jgi:hypothetical protein
MSRGKAVASLGDIEVRGTRGLCGGLASPTARARCLALGVVAGIGAVPISVLGGCELTALSATSTCAEFAAVSGDQQRDVADELSRQVYGETSDPLAVDVAYLALATYCRNGEVDRHLIDALTAAQAAEPLSEDRSRSATPDEAGLP